MQMTGEYRIPAPPERVWQALNDTEVLKRCIPGCQSVEKLSDTEFSAKVGLAIGPVKATFNGKVTLSDLDPPRGYTIQGEGQGGVAGFGKGGAKVALAPDGAGTLLTYSAEATVGGKLAQIGSRLVDATAKKLADEFFGRFAQELTPPAEAPPPEAAAPGAPAAAETAAPATLPPRPALRPAIWIPAVIALAAAILWLFARG